MVSIVDSDLTSSMSAELCEQLLLVLPSLYLAGEERQVRPRIARAFRQVCGARRCQIRPSSERERERGVGEVRRVPLGGGAQPVEARLYFAAPPSEEQLAAAEYLALHARQILQGDQTEFAAVDPPEVVGQVRTSQGVAVVLRLPRQDEGLMDLAPAERTVARLLACGLSNKELGEVLGISQNTVAAHLRSIFDKLGVQSRCALVATLLPETKPWSET